MFFRIKYESGDEMTIKTEETSFCGGAGRVNKRYPSGCSVTLFYTNRVWLLFCASLFSAQVMADTVTVRGRWAPEGQIGQYTVTSLDNTADGNTYHAFDTITLQYRVSQGVVSAVGGSLPTICISKAGMTSVDAICKGGIQVNLPPSNTWFGYKNSDGSFEGPTSSEVLVMPVGKVSLVRVANGAVNYSPASISWVVPGSQNGNTDYVPVYDKDAENAQITAWAGEGDFTEFAGHYAGSVTVQLGGYSKVWTYDITLDPPPSTCTVNPPSTVDFGTVAAKGGDALLKTASTRIEASCQVYEGTGEVSKGMYLTFSPGTYGLYRGDLKKLNTSLDGIYITGGSDSSLSLCNASNMLFDGLPVSPFQVATIPAAGVTHASKDVYFSLCHDTAKTLPTGNVVSDATVNAVIQ